MKKLALIKKCKLCLIKVRNYRKHIHFLGGNEIGISSVFEGWNVIGERTVFSGSIGYASYIGTNCRISADVGRFSCVGSYVKTITGKHPLNWVSMHPAFYSKEKQCGFSFVDETIFEETNQRVKIGSDVWIGDSVNIMEGVTIGDGAVIGAGALVTKDVPPYAVVAGVPAKILRFRFDSEIIEELRQIEWWNEDVDWIKKNANSFSNVEKLIEIIKKKQE